MPWPPLIPCLLKKTVSSCQSKSLSSLMPSHTARYTDFSKYSENTPALSQCHSSRGQKMQRTNISAIFIIHIHSCIYCYCYNVLTDFYIDLCLLLLRVQQCWGCCLISSQSPSLCRDSAYVHIAVASLYVHFGMQLLKYSISFFFFFFTVFSFFWLQSYLNHFAYKNTVGNDLWRHLQMVRWKI